MYTHTQPIALRAHKKSRNGCLQCKKRKVKCDEKTPVCSQCTKHFANIRSCDYEIKTASVKRNSVVSKEVLLKAKPSTTTLVSEKDGTSVLTPSSTTNSDGKDGGISTGTEQSSSPAESPAKSSSEEEPRSSYICKQPRFGNCGCPCHQPEYTHMLLDAVLGICRICGDSPNLSLLVGRCTPLIPSSILKAGAIDPFSVLPAKSSPRVHALIYHWVHVLGLWETSIKTHYCTNQEWLTTAISSSPLFHVTLYVSSVHSDGLQGLRETPESLSYKAEAMRSLKEALGDPAQATTDETIAAVFLLTNILSVIGDPVEVTAHMQGLQHLVDRRGGIRSLVFDSTMIHMLCTMNHLTAVLAESEHLIPPSGMAYLQSKTQLSTISGPLCHDTSLLLKPFAISIGFDQTTTEILYNLKYLFAVVDCFTSQLLTLLRPPFEKLVTALKRCSMEDAHLIANGDYDELRGFYLAYLADPVSR